MTASELRRFLRKHGCTFEDGAKHTKVTLGDKVSWMPRHPSLELKTGTMRAILKDLAWKGADKTMYRYPALFEPDRIAGGFVVTFPDFGAGATQGETIQEAMEMASDLLKSLVADRIRKKEDLPAPRKARGKHIKLVSMPALAEAKATLYMELRSSGIRKAELARRLGVAKPQVDRLLNLDNSSRFDQVEAAFRVIGKRLNIEVENAA